MPLNTAFFAADLANMIRDLPAQMKHGGAVFACSLSSLGNQDAFEDVVVSRMATLLATCLLSSFTKRPKPEDTVTIQRTGSPAWEPYFVDSVSFHEDGIGVALTLRANQDSPAS